MFFPAALIATLAAVAAAQTPESCSSHTQGYFAVRAAANYNDGQPTTYVGTIPVVTSVGLDGHKDPIVVSQYKNGTALPRQVWEFASCSNLSSHAVPPGYTYPNGPVNLYFGIIRPAGDTYRCLSLSSTNYNTTGAKNTLLDAANCTLVPETYRTFMLEDQIYGDSGNGMRLFYANADDTTTIASTPHNETLLTTNSKTAGSSAKQLLLLPTFL